MKRTLVALACLLVMSITVLAGDHPEANFGIYGIRHYSSLSDYQNNYVGQSVKYLPNCMNATKGSYSDQEHFLKAGGSYDKEYVISKITGNDKRMMFLLTEKDGKGKVKMVVNNQDEYYSFGKYNYCITDNYTVPLLLIDKFNQDKANYIGKTYGNGAAQLEVTDALTKVEKPSNSSVRYGNTTTITDKDITKFSYVDNFIDILIFATNSQFGFVLKNVSDNTLKIVDHPEYLAN